MKQATHAWIAVRAMGLIEEDAETAGLFSILRRHTRNAALGAWMPDLADSKLGSGDLDNHVFKMAPFAEQPSAISCQLSAGRDPAERYITVKKTLLKALGPSRAVAGFIKDDTSLDAAWWSTPYKAEPQPCQDIPTRANAIATTLTDQLILGERPVTNRIPRKFALSSMVSPDERTRAEQLALFFFMQSHFVADACMPCHCDKRAISSYAGRLHPQWELMIERIVGEGFDGDRVERCHDRPRELLDAARKVDSRAGITFALPIPEPKGGDLWKDAVAVCRASFAVASIVAPPSEFPYGVDTDGKSGTPSVRRDRAASRALSVKDLKADTRLGRNSNAPRRRSCTMRC
ncbi:MAG: hypothetical protein HY897_23515 [Deltaproteobacteria bacterium]|nr:hypothetical protein [Deltaproteobacteria bacterium]